ncbi:MAG: hypothetical protein QXR85_01280 [Candidatus Micrarchaeaceae archaeon]
MAMLAVKHLCVIVGQDDLYKRMPAQETVQSMNGAPVFYKVLPNHLIAKLIPEAFTSDEKLLDYKTVFDAFFPESKLKTTIAVRSPMLYTGLGDLPVFLSWEKKFETFREAVRNPENLVIDAIELKGMRRLSNEEKVVQLVSTIGIA